MVRGVDDLRTRIAYAIAQADGDLPGMEPASCDYDLADAVIAELGEAGYAIVNRAESQAAVARLIEEHSR